MIGKIENKINDLTLLDRFKAIEYTLNMEGIKMKTKEKLLEIIADIDRRIEELKIANYYFLATHLKEIKKGILDIINALPEIEK
jgi:hypothetical protein